MTQDELRQVASALARMGHVLTWDGETLLAGPDSWEIRITAHPRGVAIGGVLVHGTGAVSAAVETLAYCIRVAEESVARARVAARVRTRGG